MGTTMPIEITCSCGKRLRANEEHLGQQGQCPSCGRLLEIPGSDGVPAAQRWARAGEETRLHDIDGQGAPLGLPAGTLAESEWLSCADPLQLLEHVAGVASDRKLRLFACACCRRVWDLLTEQGQQAVEISERYADSLATVVEFLQAQGLAQYDGVGWVAWEAVGWSAPAAAKETSLNAVQLRAEQARLSVWERKFEADVEMEREEIASRAAEQASRARVAEQSCQCLLLRDIFGDPFRPASIDADWLACDDGAVKKLARGIYEDRAFARMPLLAECLERAGCTDSDILAHCRQPDGHVLGCWVLDLLLGKA
jgi:hypothetical protein